MEAYFIRHTAVAVPEGVCYGQSDVELSPQWRDDIATIKHKLPAGLLNQCAVYSSPLRRCATLANSLSTSVSMDERLKEMDFGDWELTPWDAIPQDMLTSWSNDYVNIAAPGGENYGQLHRRSVEFLEDVLVEAQQPTLVITHGGVVRSLLARLLELPLTSVFRLNIDFGGVTHARTNGEVVRVEYINR